MILVKLWKVILLLNAADLTFSANILAVFPTASYSHQQPMLALTRALANRGHNLTVFTTNPYEIPIENHYEIDLNYFYGKWDEFQKISCFNLQTKLGSFYWIGNFPKVINFVCENFFSSYEFQHFLKFNNQTKYDLFLYESLYPSLLGLTNYFGNPHSVGVLSLSSNLYTDYMIGDQVNPSFVPFYLTTYNDHMTFFQRLHNVLLKIYSFYCLYFYVSIDQDVIMRKYLGRNLPSSTSLTTSKVSLVIYSSDLSLEYPKSLSVNSIHVGAMHLKPPKPMPIGIRKWMAEAEDGVIYFSFGSNMKGTSLSKEKRIIFMKVFQEFTRYRILWKWEGNSSIPCQPENVLLKKWLPQQDILSHKNVRLFISQAGLQSTQEAIHWGVPMLAVPMFGDQFANAKKIDTAGAGIFLDLDDINLDSLRNAVYNLLTDESYRRNMTKLSKISKDKPMQAVDSAVWWIEYVLRHNGAHHLRSAHLNLEWYQVYLVDVILMLLIILFLSFCLLFYMISVLIKKIPL